MTPQTVAKKAPVATLFSNSELPPFRSPRTGRESGEPGEALLPLWRRQKPGPRRWLVMNFDLLLCYGNLDLVLQAQKLLELGFDFNLLFIINQTKLFHQ